MLAIVLSSTTYLQIFFSGHYLDGFLRFIYLFTFLNDFLRQHKCRFSYEHVEHITALCKFGQQFEHVEHVKMVRESEHKSFYIVKQYSAILTFYSSLVSNFDHVIFHCKASQ